MDRTVDHYRTLGVAPGAGDDELRRAYRDRARALHPDRHHQSPAAEAAEAAHRMREVNAAWAVLSDPSSRRRYDLERLRRRDGGSPGDSSGGSGTAGRPGAMSPPPFTRLAGPGDEPSHYVAAGGHAVIRGLLWMLTVGLLGVIFVFTAYAAADRDGDGSGTPVSTTAMARLRTGDCIEERAGAFDVVPCSGPHDAEVMALVPIGRPCPGPAREVYLPDQQESACLRA